MLSHTWVIIFYYYPIIYLHFAEKDPRSRYIVGTPLERVNNMATSRKVTTTGILCHQKSMPPFMDENANYRTSQRLSVGETKQPNHAVSTIGVSTDTAVSNEKLCPS